MRNVSPLFKEAVTSSHQSVSRARIVNGPAFQFGLNPSGTEVPILDGDVKLSSSADIKSSLDLVIPGEFWDQVQPYGTEIFVERGIDYGDGTREFVGLGYFRVEEVTQDDSPSGPIRVTGFDRTAQMMQNRVLFPYQFGYPAKTLRYAFNRLVNGDPNNTGTPSVEGYGMFLYQIVPIHWETSGISPDDYLVTGTIAEDSTFEYLTDRLDEIGLTMRFAANGELYVLPTTVNGASPVYTVRPGETGTLVKASRGASRTGVYNMVSAYGSDPAFPTGYNVAYNKDQSSPLRWDNGRFGAAPRYYASPVLRNNPAALSAAERLLGQYRSLPYSLSLMTVPNPALEPFDVIDVVISGKSSRHVVDEVTVPLTADQAVSIETRTLTVQEGG